MRNHLPSRHLPLLLLVLTPLFALHAGIMDSLSPAQKSQVENGDQLTVLEEVTGKPWPKIKVYRTIEATPEEVTAVFSNYQNAKNFIPNLLKSDIAQKSAPNVVDVDYGLDIPIFPDEYYSIRNTIRSLPNGAYRVEWKLLRALQTKDTEGSMLVEPYGNKSVICYQNLVTPGSSIAGLLKGKAISQMEETVEAIAQQVERQKNQNPKALAAEIQELRSALK